MGVAQSRRGVACAGGRGKWERQATVVEQGCELAGDGAVALLGGVQPVGRPERADVDLGVRGQVDADPAVRRVDLVVDRVQHLDASPLSVRPSSFGRPNTLLWSWKRAVQQDGTLGGELAGALEQVLAKPVGVPRRPQSCR